jgi:hypothetical protein
MALVHKKQGFRGFIEPIFLANQYIKNSINIAVQMLTFAAELIAVLRNKIIHGNKIAQIL